MMIKEMIEKQEIKGYRAVWTATTLGSSIQTPTKALFQQLMVRIEGNWFLKFLKNFKIVCSLSVISQIERSPIVETSETESDDQFGRFVLHGVQLFADQEAFPESGLQRIHVRLEGADCDQRIPGTAQNGAERSS